MAGKDGALGKARARVAAAKGERDTTQRAAKAADTEERQARRLLKDAKETWKAADKAARKARKAAKAADKAWSKALKKEARARKKR